MVEQIRFWGAKGHFGVLSNFYPSQFKLNGTWYQTNEHYFQSQKFAGTRAELYILSLTTPAESAREGKRRDFPLRKDWEQVKEEVMLTGLRAKFSQNDRLAYRLLQTYDAELIEASPYDYYWGVGKDGSGKNRLGVLLMQVRDNWGLPN